MQYMGSCAIYFSDNHIDYRHFFQMFTYINEYHNISYHIPMLPSQHIKQCQGVNLINVIENLDACAEHLTLSSWSQRKVLVLFTGRQQQIEGNMMQCVFLPCKKGVLPIGAMSKTSKGKMPVGVPSAATCTRRSRGRFLLKLLVVV